MVSREEITDVQSVLPRLFQLHPLKAYGRCYYSLPQPNSGRNPDSTKQPRRRGATTVMHCTVAALLFADRFTRLLAVRNELLIEGHMHS